MYHPEGRINSVLGIRCEREGYGQVISAVHTFTSTATYTALGGSRAVTTKAPIARRPPIRGVLDQGILVQNPGGGRSTSYRIAEM